MTTRQASSMLLLVVNVALLAIASVAGAPAAATETDGYDGAKASTAVMVDNTLLQQKQDLFALMDLDTDGLISVEEIMDLRSVGEDEARDIMEHYDEDGDGFLNLEEFMKASFLHSDNTFMEHDAHRQRSFGIFDDDHDGQLSKEEYEAHRETLEPWEELLEELDTDHNGQLSLEEFMNV